MRLALAIVLLALATGCSPQRTIITRPLDEIARSEHFVFRSSAGDRINVEWQEHYFDWATKVIGVTIDRPIQYNKYLTREHMNEVIGVGNSNAHADVPARALHTLWKADNHETIHLLASRFAWPAPVPLYREGFAVAHQVDPVKGDLVPKWNGKYLREHVASLRADGRYVAPHAMLTAAAFRRIDDVVSYPISGAFVKYLLDRFGYEKVKDVMRKSQPTNDEKQLREAFASVFGAPIDQVEAEWLTSLVSGQT